MNNNDILRRLRYAFDYSDQKMVEVFNHTDFPVTKEDVSSWLRKDDAPDFQKLKNVQLVSFLNGLIIEKRGKREGEQPKPEKQLSRNIILLKLKIALNLKSEEILEILLLSDFRLSKHELSAFFRRPDHKHYRECKDQVLRNFLNGLQIKHRQG